MQKARGYEDEPNDLDRFLGEVLHYIYWTVPEAAFYSSVYRTWIQELEAQLGVSQSAPLHNLQNDCIHQREEMRMRWSGVSKIFASIKVKTVSR